MADFIPYPQFLLFGDSLIQNANEYHHAFCFSAALQMRYERRLDVVNRGMSGYNTDQALQLLPRIIASPERSGQIKYLLLLFGANDASLITSSSGQHVPLSRYRENLKKLLNHPLVAEHDPKIIFVVPPPVDAARCHAADMRVKGIDEVRREASVTAEYCQAAREIGSSEVGDRGVVVDLWTAFMETAIANTPDYEHRSGLLLGSRCKGECKALVDLLSDGLHMSGKGYQLFYEVLIKAMETKWPEDVPEKMRMIHPAWEVAFK